MTTTPSEQIQLADRIYHLVDLTMAIPIKDLELLLQEAHDAPTNQIEDPEEAFKVSRQAIRLFWIFRINLEYAADPQNKLYPRGRHRRRLR